MRGGFIAEAIPKTLTEIALQKDARNDMEDIMDAIVIAGGIPQPEEPLYEYTQGIPKAMLNIAGKPMVQWVLDASATPKMLTM